MKTAVFEHIPQANCTVVHFKWFNLNQEEQYLLSYDDVKQIMLVVAGKTRGIDVFSHNSVVQVEWKHVKACVNSK